MEPPGKCLEPEFQSCSSAPDHICQKQAWQCDRPGYLLAFQNLAFVVSESILMSPPGEHLPYLWWYKYLNAVIVNSLYLKFQKQYSHLSFLYENVLKIEHRSLSSVFSDVGDFSPFVDCVVLV